MVSSSDFYALVRCERRLWLDRHRPSPAGEPSEFQRDLAERGRDHRRRVRDMLPGRVGPLWRPGEPLEPAALETLRLLRETRAPLERPVLLAADASRASLPDFLYWDGDGLVVLTARLGGSLEGRPEVALELTLAAELLEESAGIVPARLEVVTGRGTTREVPRVAAEELAEAVERARALLSAGAAEPELLQAHSTCEACPYYEPCWDRAVRERWLAVLPALRKSHLAPLAEAGIGSMVKLAAASPEALLEVKGVGRAGPALVHEARAFLTGEAQWIAPPALPPGRPCVWFDLEADTEDETHGVAVYLWGFAVETDAGPFSHQAVLSEGGEDRDAETWRRFLDAAAGVLALWPDACWVHYAAFERTWVRKYAQRWGDPDGVAVRLLDRLYDLHEGVVKSVRLPLRSYGIKPVAGHLGHSWRRPGGAAWSLVQYRTARREPDPEARRRLLGEIVAYNADDLLALRAVWSWLEAGARSATV